MLYWDLKMLYLQLYVKMLYLQLYVLQSARKSFRKSLLQENNPIINILRVTDVTHIVEMGINTEGT